MIVSHQSLLIMRGKNATDSSLIIDAMDLLYTRRFDGFCLVSSDSDFTRLASRLREEGLTVYGFGEEKTPQPFVSACDKFIYTELLRDDSVVTASSDVPAAVASAKAEPAPTARKYPKAPVDFISKIMDDIADEGGWAALGTLGANITKLRPGFDPRTHGFKKLSDLVRAYPHAFELQMRGGSTAGAGVLYARHKQPGIPA